MTTYLKMASIEKHEDFPSCRATMDDIAGLMESIKQYGLLVPLVVWKIPLKQQVKKPWGTVNERFFLIDGFRRHQALSHINPDINTCTRMIPVEIKTGTLDQMLLLRYQLNTQEIPLNFFERGEVVRFLMTREEQTQAGLADKLLSSQATVSLLMKLFNGKDYAPMVLDFLREDLLTHRMIRQMLHMTVPQQMAFCDTIKRELFPPGVVNREMQELVAYRKEHRFDEESNLLKEVQSLQQNLEENNEFFGKDPKNITQETIYGLLFRQQKILEILEQMLND